MDQAAQHLVRRRGSRIVGRYRPLHAEWAAIASPRYAKSVLLPPGFAAPGGSIFLQVFFPFGFSGWGAGSDIFCIADILVSFFGGREASGDPK